jgi:2-keto-4-pentenoate hydratase
MKEADIDKAAAFVVEARLARLRLKALPTGLAVTRIEHGYAIQDRANTRLAARLGQRVGYKIGGTTETMRDYIRVEEPVAGEIFESTVHASGARLRLGDYVQPGIETEIAVRLAAPLRRRVRPYEMGEVAEAVGSIMAAIELVDDRYEDFRTMGAPLMIADNAFDAGSVLGSPIQDWRTIPLDRLRARTFIDGRLVVEAMSSELMGHPLAALTWLANHLSNLGRGLEAGCFVSLGSITPVQWVREPCTARIDVEGLGSVEVTLA